MMPIIFRLIITKRHIWIGTQVLAKRVQAVGLVA
jgi:hypothetical protein